MTISLVLDTFKSRQFSSHHSENESSSLCRSPSVLVMSMITVSSEYLINDIPGVVLLQSLVYRVKRSGEMTEPCGEPVDIVLTVLR